MITNEHLLSKLVRLLRKTSVQRPKRGVGGGGRGVIRLLDTQERHGSTRLEEGGIGHSLIHSLTPSLTCFNNISIRRVICTINDGIKGGLASKDPLDGVQVSKNEPSDPKGPSTSGNNEQYHGR